jgi:2-keto-4-pentenoate hydratase/2-oxohepta-3-ene-1,7-dioic acid hydratase in catechol pathway
MKLLRFAGEGSPRLGVLRGGEIVPLELAEVGLPTMLSIIEGGEVALSRVREFVDSSSNRVPPSEVRLLAPIERPGKYLAIGMNFRKHAEGAAALGVETPKQQFWFNKQTSCIAGPFDPIDPGVSEKVDYEVELGVVIGRTAKAVQPREAASYVFGYFSGRGSSRPTRS